MANAAKQFQRALAHVMLDAFGIAFGCLGVQSEAEQKLQHDLVSVAAFARQRPALFRQEDRAIFGPVIRPSRASRSSVLATVGAVTPIRVAMSTGRASP